MEWNMEWNMECGMECGMECVDVIMCACYDVWDVMLSVMLWCVMVCGLLWCELLWCVYACMTCCIACMNVYYECFMSRECQTAFRFQKTGSKKTGFKPLFPGSIFK